MAASNSYDVIVVGGGAAGLMTAWQAGQLGCKVLLLERARQCGRKILMSGGGRCNFTNRYVSADNFISANPHFVKSALQQYTQEDFIAEVEAHAIAYHERDHGQLFCDNSSRDILDMLLCNCESASVSIRTRCEIEAVSRGDGFGVHSNQATFNARALVVATGGLSIPSMQPTAYGYELARQFDMRVTDIRASLVPLTFSGALKDMFSRLAGVSLPVEITAGKRRFSEALLFTHRGLSGPAILQISNYVVAGQAIGVNLLPDIDAEALLAEARQQQARSLMRTVLARHLPKNAVLEFEQCWWPQYKSLPLAEWPGPAMRKLATQLGNWQLRIAGSEGYRTAEITLGGVDTRDLSSQTMQSKTCDGLYFVGEVVDVTGHLGGFNFQWAWSSGFACARALAEFTAR